MLSLQNIKLHFSYKNVLNDISLTFEDGKIYSILGENGAGKTTLANIISGDRKPTAGKIFLNGNEVHFSRPYVAIQKGICCVHQRPLLADSISIRENLLIGVKKVNKEKMELLVKEFIPGRKLSTPVGLLSPSEHFFVSLVGSLLKNPSVLILDEPSALLSHSQREFLFEKIKKFADSGMTIIVISHFISEALKESDKVILLKDGYVLLEEDSSNLTEQQIKKQLFDVEEKSECDDEKWPANLPIEFVHNIDEKKLSRTTADGKKVGIIPADRTFRGSNPNLSIIQLMCALHTEMPEYDSKLYAQKLLDKAQVDISLNEKAYCLSGGMLQRLILQREIAEKPDILILCEPRQGLDPGAVRYLFEQVEELCAQGVKIIVQEAIS